MLPLPASRLPLLGMLLGSVLLTPPETGTPRLPPPGQPISAQEFFQAAPAGYDFYFTRAVYGTGLARGFRRYASWATDFPKADEQFVIVIDRTLELLDVYQGVNPVRLDDPELRRFPFLYMLEVGYMSLSDEEVRGLRDYLLSGGFLVVDDFWGTAEWNNFEYEMRRVFPELPIVELGTDHQLFNTFYDIEEIKQVPAANNLYRRYERDGIVPHIRGIHDDKGRLMMVINWNSDLGDAWEWSERPEYPFDLSSYAYKLAVNFIIYSLTH
ncbi:MAG: DUF4159 domain-containing protein [Gemmatimonadota bacterium]